MSFILKMFPIRPVEGQVPRTIIRWVVIQMVNHFTGFQRPPDLLLHHQKMLKHISILAGAGMVWTANKNITLPRFNITTTLPIRIILPPLFLGKVFPGARHRTTNTLVLQNLLPTNGTVPKVFHPRSMAMVSHVVKFVVNRL